MPQTKTKTAKPAKAERKTKTVTVRPIHQRPQLETGAPPDWVNETPDDNSYDLVMYEGGGSSEQTVPLYREEFIMLKRFLAAVRGHALRAPMDHWDVNELMSKSEGERNAAILQIAQEEIQMIMDCERALDVLVVNIRCRLLAGAQVKPGDWVIESDSGEIDTRQTDGGSRNGLNIVSVKEKAALAVATV